MNEIALTLAVSSAFLIAVLAFVLAFLPSKQLDLRPVRVRRDGARRYNRR